MELVNIFDEVCHIFFESLEEVCLFALKFLLFVLCEGDEIGPISSEGGFSVEFFFVCDSRGEEVIENLILFEHGAVFHLNDCLPLTDFLQSAHNLAQGVDVILYFVGDLLSKLLGLFGVSFKCLVSFEMKTVRVTQFPLLYPCLQILLNSSHLQRHCSNLKLLLDLFNIILNLVEVFENIFIVLIRGTLLLEFIKFDLDLFDPKPAELIETL